MAKADVRELLDKWRNAEDKYRTLVDSTLEGGRVDKDAVVALTKARVRADRRMQDYLKRALDKD